MIITRDLLSEGQKLGRAFKAALKSRSSSSQSQLRSMVRQV